MKIEVSNGEILDKFSILKIKSDAIKDKDKLANVNKEMEILHPYVLQILSNEEVELLFTQLQIVNSILWDIEDSLRELERRKQFDEEFIELARSVYFTNDRRSEIKKQINLATKSDIVEEKSYESY